MSTDSDAVAAAFSRPGLRVRQEAGLLARDVFYAAAELPYGSRGEDLADQMRRAATSIFANLAEGEGRRSAADRLQFFTVAWGSLLELEAHCELAACINLLPPDHALHLRQRSRRVGRMLHSLLRSLAPGAPFSSTPRPAVPPSGAPQPRRSGPPSRP